MNFKKLKKTITTEIKINKLLYIFLFAVLLLGFFLLVYRSHELMSFYYDQGRDALVIWRLWHEGKPFLIGPVTGLAGIFLGPFYYYLIAPFYLIGGGNPVYPAVFLAFLSIVAIFLLFYLGKKFHSKEAGMFAALIGAFSYRIVLAGRWLANPTAILLTSLLFLYSMWNIASGKDKRWWIAAMLLIGISLQLEAASAVFYLPTIVLFAIWQRRNLPNAKNFMLAIIAFFTTLLPQILFNFRHNNLLLNNFRRVLIAEKSFRMTMSPVWEVRTQYFWSVFRSKIFPEETQFAQILITLLLFILLVSYKKLKKPILPLFMIFLLTPMVGLLLFQGNYGNVYDYYLTGYYLPFILLMGISLGEVLKRRWGRMLVILFFLVFFIQNGLSLKNYFTTGKGGQTKIALGNELQAVDWIFNDAKGRGGFNVDVYVPPVIPYSYDYLLLWQGSTRCGESLCGLEKNKQVELLYTLYEVDPPHPWRLEAWMDRQEGIAEVVEEVRFEGITVQRRKRL